jgi:hypothetical protein
VWHQTLRLTVQVWCVDVNFRAMLHATLHGKLEESVPEPQRLEDALTSSIFGTLMWLDAWDVLARWLSVPYDRSADIGTRPNECWFWPRLAFAEPDVVLRLGNTLVFVEAKYRSDRHDLTVADGKDEDSCDQLVRQHQCFTEPPSQRQHYAEGIEEAIRECRLVQAFVVDARRLPRARREWEQSKGRLPADASINLITWQALYRTLSGQGNAHRRWVADLLEYLRHAGLDTFDGISRWAPAKEGFQWVHAWRPRSETEFSLRAAITMTQSQAGLLNRWRSPVGREVRGLVFAIDPGIIKPGAQAVIYGWRAPKTKTELNSEDE